MNDGNIMGEIEYRTFVSELAEEAKGIAGKEAAKQNYRIDPITIITIVSVILQIVKFILEWYYGDANKSAQSLGKFSFVQKWMLWRYCRKEAKNKREARLIYDALCKTISNMNEDERIKLFNLARYNYGK